MGRASRARARQRQPALLRLDPANAEISPGFVLEALARADPPNAKYYEARGSAFLDQLAAKLREWSGALSRVQGRPMLAYHNSWAYLARRFRLDIAGTSSRRQAFPGPAHLAALLRKMRDEKIEVIVRQPFEPEKTPAFLGSKSGARVIVLAASVGACRSIGLPGALRLQRETAGRRMADALALLWIPCWPR